VFPKFHSEAAFAAQGLAHPLLLRESCVANDAGFDAQTRFWIISGSNMAGKSTLLRSIGLNVVLALAGAPVRAESLSLAPFRICASISIADSLLEGKSRFMAEVERIRDTIAAASAGPVLFLIDEIFSGTNSHDRRIAAESVVKALIASGAIGALSTHDLALTEIAPLPGLMGENVHMCSRSDEDALDFDYLVKPGVNRQSNALAIVKLAGVPL
jgi:DNA mismatch repair ATPase MutS